MMLGMLFHLSKFADQLSGTRQFNVPLSIMEGHRASKARRAAEIISRMAWRMLPM
jgi:hypothetical protein